MPRVLNKYKDSLNGAIYIGRPSKWGNPYTISKHGTRAEVITMYNQYIHLNSRLYEDAQRELKGKNLVCFCAPHACHGDILLKIANG